MAQPKKPLPPKPHSQPPAQRKAKAKITASKNRQSVARYKAAKLRATTSTQLANAQANYAPKLTTAKKPKPTYKQLIKLQPNACVWLATTQQIWQIGIARYTTQQITVKAYLTSLKRQPNGMGIAVCYIPRTATTVGQYVQASLTANGLLQYWLLPQSNLALAVQTISQPKPQPKPAKPPAAKANTNLPAKIQPAKAAKAKAALAAKALAAKAAQSRASQLSRYQRTQPALPTQPKKG